MVTAAVEELIACSNAIAELINETVLPDYDGFVASGRQYNADAEHVNGIVTEFNAMAEKVNLLINEITETVDGIAVAIEESATSVADVTDHANSLVLDINAVSGEMDENRKIADALYAETERFV